MFVISYVCVANRAIISFMERKYQDIVSKCEPELEEINKSHNTVGWSKLILIISFLVSIYFTVDVMLWFLAVLLPVFAFLIYVGVYHHRLKKRMDYLWGTIEICHRHIARINGEWAKFADKGQELVSSEHPYSSDLDIVGDKSFFQYLNTTNTWYGRAAFAKDLLDPKYELLVIKQRQQAIKELSSDIQFSNDAVYHFGNIGVDPSTPKLVEELKDNKQFLTSKILCWILTFFPVLSFAIATGFIIWNPPNGWIGIVTPFAIQIIACIAGGRWLKKYFGTMTTLTHGLNNYTEAVEFVTSKDYESEKLQKIKQSLTQANLGIKKLGSVSSMIEARRNGVARFIMNTLIMWDYQCALSLQKWKNKHSENVDQWFDTLGEFESLLCFSHLPNICSNTCLPTISEQRSLIIAKNLGHPLLSNEKRVNNDFDFANSILIISGSNMSGKTTFLRTIGINIVLARSGSFATALELTCTPFAVMTSMRIADDLNQGISTFYAELKRIKSVINYAKENKQFLFLIDEIFRGTNSVDRLSGARTVLQRLDSLGASGMVSTHDLELCDLDRTSNRIRNYSFSEDYKDKQIVFDYKLRSGKSTTTNATYLMEMVGIR